MYQALYNKYRPITFDDVISQSHITTTLKNQIMTGKTAHAYLFTGSRGTGKTTCARIFAKALACEHTVNGSPCNECDICADADNFALADIIEIDAASNGSVNDARELREAAVYTPERCRYKIYIIDEVHMLSKEAFNALLKIIEEPPEHIKFIMATTELHKVLPTILSRCQRFDFMRIRTEDIASRLLDIAAKEGITLETDAADLIAKTADGGMRDALSILDRCIAFSENITADVVSEAAGIAGREYLFGLAEAIIEKDCPKALDIVSELYDRSKDMQRLCEELTAQFRNIMIAVSAPDRMNIIVCLPSELETIKAAAAKIDIGTVLAHLEALGKCAERMTRSLSKRIDMEMCIIRMCSYKPQEAVRSAVDNSVIAQLTSKIAALEEQLKNNAAVPARQQPAFNGGGRSPQSQVTDMTAVTAETKHIAQWSAVCDRLRELSPSLAPNLIGTHGLESDKILVINTKKTFIRALLSQNDNKDMVLKAVKDVTGKVYSSVRVGYKAAWDLSLRDNGDSPQLAQTEQSSDPAANLSALLKKAEDGGVSVENT